MEKIYLNYASTSYKKPERTIAALTNHLNRNLHSNFGRNIGGTDEGSIALDARIALCDLFNHKKINSLIFTNNVSTALNMVLLGILQEGDHVITTSMEHNSVSRPLHLLEEKGIITTSYLSCDSQGRLDPSLLEKAIKKNTKLIVMTHASNVCGTIMPVKECFKIAKEKGLITVLDAAQTAGFLDIDMENSDIDLLCFTGHKSLLGLTGSGGFIMKSGIESLISPVFTGGTGSRSDSLSQPDFLPDKFEIGTQNTLGILSLLESAKFLKETGLENIRKQEGDVFAYFLNKLADLPLHIYGTRNVETSVPVVSLSSEKIDAGIFSQRLFDEYGIITRSGLHCSPLAHQTLGTFPAGTLRFSTGLETTKKEIDYTIEAIESILK